MSWRDAPLYIATFDLAQWVLRRVDAEEGVPPTASRVCLSHRILAAVTDLVELVSLALTFPEHRDLHLRSADETVVRLRVELRLAHGLGQLPTRSHEHACRRLAEIGRMIGGWRKRVSARPADRSKGSRRKLKSP